MNLRKSVAILVHPRFCLADRGVSRTLKRMPATDWEFKNRAMLFGIIFGVSFFLSSIDHVNSASWLAGRLGAAFGTSEDLIARIVFAIAALLLIAAATVRSWASAYLKSEVVYASEIKTADLVADGPYRHVRNPLYFGNVLMALGLGAMASRTGFVVLQGLMLAFCYRLVFREEAELRAAQGEPYDAFKKAVPRLCPALTPRTAAAGGKANWAAGFRAEGWVWCFALAVTLFAITLKMKVFLIVLAVLGLFVTVALAPKRK
jgi:protein-S-isoprenylcysteine O-methyltransferase Ste14